MAKLALVPKEGGIIEKYELGKYVHAVHSGGNAVFKDPFSSIEESSLGIESFALDDVKEDRLSVTYPTINPVFLAKEGSLWNVGDIDITTPFFAVYSLNSPYCELAVKKYFGGGSPLTKKIKCPKIPQIIASQLLRAFANKKVFSMAMVGVFSKDGVCFTSKFKGLIPSSVKKEINKAMKYFGNQIFMVAKGEWEINNPSEIVDPLVIGVHKNICYLISEFDTTPIEELAKNYVKK